MTVSKAVYPSTTEIGSTTENLEYVPQSLRLLLDNIFTERDCNLKKASIGQSIIQATRPRSTIAPLQLGLGVQMHHHFGSKFLIDTLYRLGFSASYKEIQKYEVNAALQGHDIPEDLEGRSLQHIADNVDHNIRTLDGHGTFHGMGIVAAVTPGFKRNTVIPRLNVTIEEIKNLGKIEIQQYKLDAASKLSFNFESLAALRTDSVSDSIGTLCSTIWPKTKIGWSAMCNLVQNGLYPGQSTVVFLPMIDLDPSSLSCIYSTLQFVCKEAQRHNTTPVLTFDQPLYWKALTIVDHEPENSTLKSIVLRLGGFHLQMSFLGSIGHIMSGSGLAELLESIFAPNAVTHMMSGKATARAIRGHFLTYNALNTLITSEAYGISSVDWKQTSGEDQGRSTEDTLTSSYEDGQETSVTTEDDIREINRQTEQCYAEINRQTEQCYAEISSDLPTELKDLIQLSDSLLEGHLSVTSLDENNVFQKVALRLRQYRESLLEFRTARLWIQYMDMIDLLRQFIKAERTGDWNLHLQSIKEMLPYFAASGHNLYLKSAYIYLQQMLDLASKHPDVYERMMSGFHVIRRTDKFWSGLSPDLVIEQMLMRSIKSTGGLTRGRGMTEAQRSLWILSMPQCAQVNDAMQQITDVNFESSEQHKEMGQSRRERDYKDTFTLLEFLEERNPFAKDTNLRNIETGTTGENAVNADQALTFGRQILISMEGQPVNEYVFKKNKTVTTLSTKLNVKVNGEEIGVDPQLLFQRLVTAANNIFPDVSEVFRYELSNVPPALFEASGLMRQAQKSTLAESIWNLGECSYLGATIGNDEVYHVIDGGSLLQRLPWKKGATFAMICQSYVDYVSSRYNKPIIVFDGYSAGPTTKDHVHERRTRGITGTHINFKDNTPFKSKKEIFLAHNENKQNFLNMLSEKMENHGFRTEHAVADADVLIARTAVEYSTQFPTIVIGEDTDLLILLLYHARENGKPLLFQSDKASRTSKVWDIQKTKLLIGEEICQLMPFAHAFTGCDTTSRLYGIGKGIALKRLLDDANFRHLASIFVNPDSIVHDVIKSGQEAMSVLYGGTADENLDTLRYRKFASKVVSNSLSCVQVQTLPPTSDAAAQHCKRVFYQIQEWTNESIEHFDPKDWGWFLQDGLLHPIRAILPPAPERLLHVVRCKCKSSCDTRKCTCRKHGLECSTACSECKGQNCSNCHPNDLDDDQTDLLT